MIYQLGKRARKLLTLNLKTFKVLVCLWSLAPEPQILKPPEPKKKQYYMSKSFLFLEFKQTVVGFRKFLGIHV